MPDERTTLKNAVNKLLKTLEPNVYWEKRWGGGYGKTGVFDYTGVAWGIPFALEIKNPKFTDPIAHLSKEQLLWQRKYERAGGKTAVASSMGQVELFFAALSVRATAARLLLRPSLASPSP